jgi:hypothetical protein
MSYHNDNWCNFLGSPESEIFASSSMTGCDIATARYEPFIPSCIDTGYDGEICHDHRKE